MPYPRMSSSALVLRLWPGCTRVLYLGHCRYEQVRPRSVGRAFGRGSRMGAKEMVERPDEAERDNLICLAVFGRIAVRSTRAEQCGYACPGKTETLLQRGLVVCSESGPLGDSTATRL